MQTKFAKIAGCILTFLLSFLFIMSAYLKLSQNETAIAQAEYFGINAKTYLLIGIVEMVSLILFIIPRTGVLGTLMLAAYLGGAIATHLQHQQPIVIPVLTQTLLWVTAVIRFPEVKYRLMRSML